MSGSNRNKDIQKAQLLSQQLKSLEEQLQIFERRRVEVSTALSELKKAKEKGQETVYKFLGANILIKKDINSVEEDLEEELTTLDKRISIVKKQIEIGRKELEQILRDLGYIKGPSTSLGG